jgi:hypothetical protein
MPVISDIVTTTRASTGTYFDSSGVMRTAANNVWRRDHDPLTREPLGVLIEEQRTNLALWSSEFTQASWTANSVVLTPNSSLAPDGTISLTKVVPEAGTGQYNIFARPLLADNTQYTVSFFIKAAGYTWAHLRARSKDNLVPRAWFNLATATKGSASAEVVDYGVRSVGGGICLCWMVFNSGIGSTIQDVGVQVNNGDLQANTTTDGVSGIYIWGAQLEVGAFPTSYIPTTTAAATRAGDGLSILNGWQSTWFNPAQGAFVAEYSSFSPPANQIELVDRSSAAVGLALFENSSGRLVLQTFSPGTSTTQTLLPAITRNSVHRAAAAYSLSEQALTVDGAAPVAGAKTASPIATGSQGVHIGRSLNSGGRYINGHIKRIQYFPRRLSNTELQSATVLS